MAMNIFRLAGDGCHMWSHLFLLDRLIRKKNALGLSPKTQWLSLLVFVCRYLDLFTTYYSMYNSLVKIFYLSTTSYILYALYYSQPMCNTCDKARDTFPLWRILVPTGFMTLLWSLYGNSSFGLDVREVSAVGEILWCFSIFLESLVSIPQLFLVFQYRELDQIAWIYHYLFFKIGYRALYVANWVYRAHQEPYFRHHYQVYFAGVLQALVAADIAAFYFKRRSVLRWLLLRNADMAYVDSVEGDNDAGPSYQLVEDRTDENELLLQGEGNVTSTSTDDRTGHGGDVLGPEDDGTDIRNIEEEEEESPILVV